MKPPWTKHAQIEWDNRAADTNLPLWLRMVCLAYGRHEANGHANFRAGALAWMLGTPPSPTDSTPSFKRVDRTQVRDAIKTAVTYGWLADGSCSECLIVPAHAIEGPVGNADKTCPVHDRKTQQKRARLHAVS